MKFQLIKNQKFRDTLFYLIIFCIVIICLISIISPVFAKLKAATTTREQARLIYFQPIIQAQETTNQAWTNIDTTNNIEFDQDTTNRTFHFNVHNTSEAAIHVKAIELANSSGHEVADYEFLTDTDFYLLSGESKNIDLKIFSADPSYFHDIQEELNIEIITEQVN